MSDWNWFRRTWESWKKKWSAPVVTPPPPPPPVITPPPTPTGVVFRDDFTNGLWNWKLYSSVGHDGNGLRRPSQISTVDGVLKIVGDANGTTGGMSLIGHDIRFGKVSVRLRAPKGAGKYHPVALLWGLGSGSAVDAITGEIDFVEFWNLPNRDRNSFTLHYGDGSQMIDGDTPVVGTEWHVYSVLWTPEFIEAFVDGVSYYRTTDKAKFPKGSMELCLQLDWFPHENTSDGDGLMEVDWVQIEAL